MDFSYYKQFPFFLNNIRKRRSFVMKVTNILRKEGYTFGEAQSKAWTFLYWYVEFMNGMPKEFSFYRKTNGEERKAIGTRNDYHIGKQMFGSGNQYPIEKNQVGYYDFEKTAYRSFCISNLDWNTIRVAA